MSFQVGGCLRQARWISLEEWLSLCLHWPDLFFSGWLCVRWLPALACNSCTVYTLFFYFLSIIPVLRVIDLWGIGSIPKSTGGWWTPSAGCVLSSDCSPPSLWLKLTLMFYWNAWQDLKGSLLDHCRHSFLWLGGREKGNQHTQWFKSPSAVLVL